MNKITKPKFLKNTPLGEDLFEGKSQEKIADVVSSILKEKDFQIIGIDGSWGTGKSNLIGIVQKKLSNHSFFLYDVWGHQEDDQRKAILVELTDFISDEKSSIIKDKKKWKNKLKVLLSKEKEVTTINRPYLSVGFIFSLFSIIYIPSVNVFKDDLTDFLEIERIFWKFILVLFPIFIVLGIYVINYFSCLFSKNGFWSSFKLASQKTFQVYTNKQEEETKTETISENEPSVKDFRGWMKEIDIDLKDKKLVLVFDNFDRLPKKNILSIWSSIHIFFAEEKYKNIKIIIPFDRNHIKNAFSDLDAKNGKHDFANDYINKTFDLVYRVSPPILSDWKIFFKERWKEAFINLDEQEYLKVEQIYETYRPTITPREIIACINEIVSITLLDETIPKRYIAIFVLNKELIIDNPLKAITEPSYLKGLSYLYIGDDNFQKYITALAYQINPENALEIAYQKQLKDSLVNNKPDVFIEISKTNTFSKIILSVISEIENFENPILVLDKLAEESIINAVEKENIWNDVFIRTKDLEFDDFEIRDFQKVIINHISEQKAILWLKTVLNQLRNNDDFDALKFAKMMDDLDSYLKGQASTIDIYKLLAELKLKDIEPENLIALVVLKGEDYLQYSISVDNEELNKHLNEQDLEKLDNASFIPILHKNYNLEQFITDLTEKVDENKADTTLLNIIFKILKQISTKPLKAKLDDVDIYSLFYSLTDQDDFYYDLLAMRLARMKAYSPSYTTYFSAILTSESEDDALKIAERIEFYVDYERFLLGSKDFTDSPLYKTVCRNIIINNYGSSANLKNLLKGFETICDDIEIEPKLFLEDLNGWEPDNITKSDIPEFPNKLFECCKLEDNKLSSHLLKNANDFFITLNADQWENIFDDFDSKDYELFKIIEFTELNSFVKEGFKKSLIKSIENKQFINPEEWNYLISKLEASGNELANTFKDIRDILYSDGTFVDKSVFKFIINPFVKYSVLSDRPGDAFRTIFKSDFLNDQELVSLIDRASESVKELMRLASPGDVSDFKQAIRDRKEANENIKELAAKLDIRSNKSSE